MPLLYKLLPRYNVAITTVNGLSYKLVFLFLDPLLYMFAQTASVMRMDVLDFLADDYLDGDGEEGSQDGLHLPDVHEH